MHQQASGKRTTYPLRVWLFLIIAIVGADQSNGNGPTVVPTAEGQIGEVPGVDDKIIGPHRFEAVPGDVLFGGIFITGGPSPPPPEVQFLSDSIHRPSEPALLSTTSSPFIEIDKVTPASAWSRNKTDDGDFVAFSFAVDGAMPETLTVRIATFDETASSLVDDTVVVDLETFMFADPIFSKTGVGVDNQGRATVAYTDFVDGLPQVRASRIDGVSGAAINADFLITDEIRSQPDVALLDPLGNRLVVITTELLNPPRVFGNIVDFSSGAPVVGPDFEIDDTIASFGNSAPEVAADPETGQFLVVWEFLDDAPGDPVNIRGRRFDADGNPIGGDFVVNTTTPDSQGQPSVAYGPNSLSAVVWAGTGSTPSPDDLDVFLQVFDSVGNPIGGEVTVNSFTDDLQDRPAVRFLPDRDATGRPQIAVTWRDVDAADGSAPRGTGISYRCFSVNGFAEEVPIFADGFESGDTTSWGSTQP